MCVTVTGRAHQKKKKPDWRGADVRQMGGVYTSFKFGTLKAWPDVIKDTQNHWILFKTTYF